MLIPLMLTHVFYDWKALIKMPGAGEIKITWVENPSFIGVLTHGSLEHYTLYPNIGNSLRELENEK